MKDFNSSSVKNFKDDETEQDATQQSRREFISKYGKLAAITPVAMTATLHAKKALASCGSECGFDGGGSFGS